MKLILLEILALISLSKSVKLKLKVYPEPDDSRSKLIWYNISTASSWSEKLDNYLEVYRAPILNPEKQDNFISCDHDHHMSEDRVCIIDTEKFNPCVATNYFGYRTFRPCVFIELQKIDGWSPRYYNDSAFLPKSMPQSLKNHIDEVTQDSYEWENVWVSCDGDTSADKELIGPLEYFPRQGFPGYMFPYTGQKDYLNPLVAVWLKEIRLGLVITVICKVWGPGIIQDEKNSIGSTTFHILVDTIL